MNHRIIEDIDTLIQGIDKGIDCLKIDPRLFRIVNESVRKLNQIRDAVSRTEQDEKQALTETMLDLQRAVNCDSPRPSSIAYTLHNYKQAYAASVVGPRIRSKYNGNG